MTDTLARGSIEDDPEDAASPPVRWTKSSRRSGCSPRRSAGWWDRQRDRPPGRGLVLTF